MKERIHRNSPLLFEQDGDFNPGWLVFLISSIVIWLLSLAAVAAVIRDGKAWPALAACLSANVLSQVVAGISVFKLGRAKLLASSPVLAKGLAALGTAAGTPPFEGMDIDERGDG